MEKQPYTERSDVGLLRTPEGKPLPACMGAPCGQAEGITMSNIPKSADWYIAELIERISVAGDLRLVVHRNMRLIRADSPDVAYTKALSLGREGEMTYFNPAGQQVSIEFLGLADLSVIYDSLEDGAELAYTRYIVGSRQESEQLVRNRNNLTIFAQVPPAEGPDYSAKEVVDMLNKPPNG